jgi:hypothetical protein
MKYKISNDRLKQLVFNLLNKQLERGKYRSWLDSYGYVDLRKNDENDGLMVLVDDEEIRIFPALYKTIMLALGMNIYQMEDFLTLWATTELPKNFHLDRYRSFSDKFVDVIH